MTTESAYGTLSPGREDLVGALEHERRRELLAVLERADAPLALADLALELARRGGAEDPHEAAADLRVSLYHCHLPKLAAAGLVDYDGDRNLVALADGGTDGPADWRATGE